MTKQEFENLVCAKYGCTPEQITVVECEGGTGFKAYWRVWLDDDSYCLARTDDFMSGFADFKFIEA